jgi:transposase-like protein
LERVALSGDVRRVAAELGISREVLYLWLRQHRTGGAAALRPMGRPRRAGGLADAAIADAAGIDEAERGRRRIAELERKIGQQQIELDFFRAALKRVREGRRENGGSGETASSQ